MKEWAIEEAVATTETSASSLSCDLFLDLDPRLLAAKAEVAWPSRMTG